MELDFLRELYGVDGERVRQTSLSVDILDERGEPSGARFRVMHPVVCLESRACNVVGLAGRDTPHGRRQLRAAVLCAQEFLRDLLADGQVREALKASKRIFEFCEYDRHGRRVWAQTGIDPFEAVLCEPPLPPLFVRMTYPRMKATIERRRSRVASILFPPRR